MNTEDLELRTLLRENRPAAVLPPRFQQNVWHRIENATSPSPVTSWLDALAALILRPRFAYAAAAALILTGVLLGVREGRYVARHDAQMNYITSVAPHPLH